MKFYVWVTHEHIYEDNLRQMISIAYVHNMYVIVGTLPVLGFTPLYIGNTSNIEKYNKIIYKLSKEINFDVCDMSGLEDYYVDGVHLTNDGNIELADRFFKTIYTIQNRK